MKRIAWTAVARELSCDVCGRLPDPPKTRQTVADIATVLPIELVVHALVVQAELPYLAKVLLLTVTATVLVLWVAEPSARRLLRTWLHAPALHRHRRLDTSSALWRARAVVCDEPGSLERIARALARLDTNILDINVHLVGRSVLDEFVLSAPTNVSEQDLSDALESGGGRDVGVWPTTALALADGQTRALSLAARVAANPSELPLAVAELLSAEIASDRNPTRQPGVAMHHLKIPSPWGEPIVFQREREPFTIAESARANRLAEIAELAEIRGTAVPGRLER